jgi:serine/threonine protein kinase
MYIQGYQVIQTIGRGSFATTYLAMKNSMYYAFKLIRSNLLEFRFLR